MYHVRCSICGFEKDILEKTMKKVKTCRHLVMLTQEQIDAWYDKNKKTCLHCGNYIPFNKNAGFNSYLSRKFCNQSCAASFNNINSEKKAYTCLQCGRVIGYGYEEFSSKRLCDDCNPLYVDWNEETYGDLKINKKAAQANGRIREMARRLYQKSDKPKQCANCGYDKHYEVCHIKGISTHSDDTPISVINDLDNLIALCPNCHWELDNGLLDITNINFQTTFQKPLDKLKNLWYNPKRKEVTTQN